MRGIIINSEQADKYCKRYGNYLLSSVPLQDDFFFIYEEQLEIEDIEEVREDLKTFPIVEVSEDLVKQPIH